MDIMKVVGYFIFMIVFVISLVISFKFQFSAEGKDERGQHILNFAYTAAFPIIPIGWLLISLYNDFINTVGYEAYKWLIWILVILAFIVHGVAIFVMKRKI